MIKSSKKDRVMMIVVSAFLVLIGIITIYPIWYVFMYSISDPNTNPLGYFYLIPYGGIHFDAYIDILRNPAILTAYGNTFIVVVFGTATSLMMTTFMAYGLTRKNLPGRTAISYFVIFTMLFNGGIIPTYLVIRNLGMINTYFAMIFPKAVSVYFLLIMMSFFRQIPESIIESATIDGCSVPGIFFKILAPLSKPAIMTIMLFYAVFYWNDFQQCMLYVPDSSKQVLQLFIRNLILEGEAMTSSSAMTTELGAQSIKPESIKMATVMVATIPILVVYPFVQKYFISGVTLGSVKG